MQKSAYSSIRDPSLVPGNLGGCTLRSRPIRESFFIWHSVPGPPLTPHDLVSYLISQDIEVGTMPQGIGSIDMDTWALQNLRFDAGRVRGFGSPPFPDSFG